MPSDTASCFTTLRIVRARAYLDGTVEEKTAKQCGKSRKPICIANSPVVKHDANARKPTLIRQERQRYAAREVATFIHRIHGREWPS